MCSERGELHSRLVVGPACSGLGDKASLGSEECRIHGSRGLHTFMEGRMRACMAVLTPWYHYRAIMEEDYAKKLTKLSKSPFGAGETG